MESGEKRQKRGSGGNNINSLPPPPPHPLQPHRCFSAHFSLRYPHYFGPVYMKVREPGLSIKSTPLLQPYRCFSAHFSLRCPHYFGPVYMKMREPGLSNKSRNGARGIFTEALKVRVHHKDEVDLKSKL